MGHSAFYLGYPPEVEVIFYTGIHPFEKHLIKKKKSDPYIHTNEPN